MSENTNTHMITQEANPAAFAAALDLRVMLDEHEQEAKALKKRFQAEMDVINKTFEARHKANWSTIEQELNLTAGEPHTICLEHTQHGVAFVGPAEDEVDEGGIGDIGAKIAAALGGRVIRGGDSGGMIHISGKND